MGFDKVLAFLNPDGKVVAVIQNELITELPITWQVGEKVTATLPPIRSVLSSCEPPAVPADGATTQL